MDVSSHNPYNEISDNCEVISSEEMCGFLDMLVVDARNRNTDTEDWMVLSLDAVGLFPALDIQKCSELVAKRVANSNLNFEGVCYKWAAKYVALGMSENEVVRKELHDVIPRRRSKHGTKATVKTIMVDQKKERWKWRTNPDDFTEANKRRIMEQVIRILVETTFTKNFYKWG